MSPPAGLRRLSCPPGLAAIGLAAWLFPLDVAERDRAGFAAMLDADERARAAQFRYDLHRDRFVARRGWRRLLIARETGIAAGALRLVAGVHGKPALDGGGAVRFNASHAGDLGLCVIARDVEVGCDLAERTDAACDLAVAERFFHPSETAAILALPAEDRPAAFLDCWTRKEAVVKLSGEGLLRPLDDFAVPVGPEAGVRLDDAGPPCSLYSLDVGRRHHAAVAVGRAPIT